MATCRRTATNENISTYGNATRDYTSLGTWENATDNDLVTAAQSEVLECYDDEDSFDDHISMSGATSNADYFRIIRPAAGQGHDGTSNNGFNIHNTADVDAFHINSDYVQLQDLVIKSTVSGVASGSRSAIYAAGEHNVVVGCIVYDCYNGGSVKNMYGILRYSSAAGSVFIDCLADNIQSLSADGIGLFGYGAGSIPMYNCTAVNCKTYGIKAHASTVTSKNCCSSGNGVLDWGVGGGGAFTKTTCTTEGASPTYKNAAGNDFHLAASDTVCRDNGTDLSGDATFPFDDDIDGELWGATWSIGFDQFSAGADDGIWTINPWTVNPWTTALFAANPWAKDDLFRFTNTSGTLNPYIVVTGTPDILWTWSDGTTDTNADPADVTCVGENTLYVSDWDTITLVNFANQNCSDAFPTKEWSNITALACYNSGFSNTFVTYAWPKIITLSCRNNNFSNTFVTYDWVDIGVLSCRNNTFTGDFAMKVWANATGLYCSDNGFSSISGDFQTQVRMTTCRFEGNAITSSSQIDTALSDLVINAGAAGRSATCAVNFSGGTNSGPTAAGTASRETLVTTHSWTVTINPEV